MRTPSVTGTTPLLRPALRSSPGRTRCSIGAPYWDLSFPAALKIWVEHMYVRNLTFRYDPGRQAHRFSAGQEGRTTLSTAGSPIG